ncbi:hypothetical protein D9619_007553 [Psilocybe cf. subviscida]|uniref:Uncharacterized protein n=1 Tax=Psilocybe cf. subviscida TaxID=2480587 RepID=A0A8H5B1P2_9AGAR|nr:hypothetical protein D9619_007553 [Psilocybe cf. subviscida]
MAVTCVSNRNIVLAAFMLAVKIPADTSLALAAAIDILIAGSLSIYLHLAKRGILELNTRKSTARVLPTSIELSGYRGSDTRAAAPSSTPAGISTFKGSKVHLNYFSIQNEAHIFLFPVIYYVGEL